MLIDWQQESSLLHIAGDSRFIGIWDLSRELKIADLATTSSSGPLTSTSAASTSSGSGQGSAMSSSGQGSSLTTALCSREHQVAAGFTDGSVKLYDVRTPSHKFVRPTSLQRPHFLSLSAPSHSAPTHSFHKFV